jgi:hypothetical protein
MKNEEQLFARQGDVGLVNKPIPAGAKRVKLHPFAYGEVTGHSHRVATADEAFIEMYEKDGRTFVHALKDVALLHEDHDPTGVNSIIPSGWEGEVRIAVEYDEEVDFRKVAD